MEKPARWPHGTLNIAYEFQEAKKSVDILADLDPLTRGPNSLGSWFHDLVRCVEPRLKRRCGVFIRGDNGLQTTNNLLQEFEKYGWEARALSVAPSQDLVIIDDRKCLEVEGHYPMATFMWGGHSKAETHSLKTHFQNVWISSQKPDFNSGLIFEDLIRTIRGSEWDTLVQNSRPYWDLVFRKIAEAPNDILQLSSRKFEELVAELLIREGFDVQLTQATRDGGYDILASNRQLGVEHLYLVECKRWSPKQTVGVSVVRTLYGVLEKERATAGIIATTSKFSSPAIDFANPLKYRLSLKGYEDIIHWITKFVGKGKS